MLVLIAAFDNGFNHLLHQYFVGNEDDAGWLLFIDEITRVETHVEYLLLNPFDCFARIGFCWICPPDCFERKDLILLIHAILGDE